MGRRCSPSTPARGHWFGMQPGSQSKRPAALVRREPQGLRLPGQAVTSPPGFASRKRCLTVSPGRTAVEKLVDQETVDSLQRRVNRTATRMERNRGALGPGQQTGSNALVEPFHGPGRSPVSTLAHETVVEGDGAAHIVQVSPLGGGVADQGAEVERQRPLVEDAAACAARARFPNRILWSSVPVAPLTLKMPPPSPASAWLPDRMLWSIVRSPKLAIPPPMAKLPSAWFPNRMLCSIVSLLPLKMPPPRLHRRRRGCRTGCCGRSSASRR